MNADTNLTRIGEKRQQKIAARIVRRRRARIAAIVGAVIVVAGVSVNLAVSRGTRRETAQASTTRGLNNVRSLQRSPVFAGVEGQSLSLRLPAAMSDIIGIGYHQAYNQKALALDSRLKLTVNATRASISRTSRAGSPRAFQMASRGRGSAPASSVDVAVRKGTPIKSPVAGKIVAVEPYLLYGLHNDVRIDILPKENPAIKISIVHLDRPIVSVGQRVQAGVTILAAPRRLPVNSQIDQYLGRLTDHIHIQINPLRSGRVAGYGS